ncbi:pathogenicity island protein [Staphylococcus edaphicus]|uniref:Pathogenicity island protein n=1 Tax=Staphylococcus edaphicus TaxID=1955013 RepID=A0A2C6WLW2_9STAP|nr:pathogenicity island protein [Staphylococcus edaphicus]PHK48784.1 pathogenicity island protein [Staphylococcus edaphicus]UQW81398.1 pathogenicity island protein [Staphylococcus edaphicus]
MDKDIIKQKVLEYIKQNVGTSFVELEQVFEDNHFNYKGNGAYSSGQHQNVIFWMGWNRNAFNILAELKHDGLISMEVCEPLVYLVDGKSLTLPVMTKPSDAKNDCWLPVTFNAKAEVTA